MSGCARILAALAMFAALASCGERGPAEPEDQVTPPGLSVSDPSAEAQSLAYVYASPGTFPGGQWVTLTNLANGASVSAPIRDGGFDPVAIAAESSHELEIVVRFTDGATIIYRTTVPPRRRPRVVRTRPPKGDTDVVLNVTAAVVFSEPLDSSTVTKETVQLLLDGDPVEGILTLSDDGLRAEFAPARLLQPGRQYTLVITQDVLDLTGDPLEEEVQVTFTTVSLPSATDQIAFVSQRDGSAQIYVMYADGAYPFRLTDLSGAYGDPAWSPDGTKIAFTAFRSTEVDIFLMDADGTNQVKLTTSEKQDRDPVWSPDGMKIAFTSFPDGDQEVYVMNADGTGQVNLSNSQGLDGDPVWSPDNSRIAFESNRDGNWEIYVVNADGTDQVNLTNSPSDDNHPAWSPDGSKIAFESNREGNDEIYVMNPDGTDPVNLTNRPLDYDVSPVWSPDGSKIAYTGWRPDYGPGVYVMNADGTGRVSLSKFSSFREYNPAWSPDNSKIAFEVDLEDQSPVDFDRDIYVIAADGTGKVNITNLSGDDLAPVWKPRR